MQKKYKLRTSIVVVCINEYTNTCVCVCVFIPHRSRMCIKPEASNCLPYPVVSLFSLVSFSPIHSFDQKKLLFVSIFCVFQQTNTIWAKFHLVLPIGTCRVHLKFWVTVWAITSAFQRRKEFSCLKWKWL